ncbi:MAG TPA: hypothetical protein VIW21_02815 [Chthoniobacterales bacterium]|jgi:TolB-like protein/cytochrome c-type biogenesis protein CcmH/NrfG
MAGFFEEVQRRKVYRVAAAYVIAAGGIIQLASAAFPAWELPNWALRLVIVLLLVGFPIALILAWAFDVTPQGIRTATAPAVPGAHRRRNLLMLIGTGVVFSAAAGFFLLPRLSARKIDKSIAVLPFENLSAEQENAYFADGVQDDILTNLSKIGDLKVISRTSVMGYRGKSQSVREIGKTLGVSNILEGSVRRSGNKVRVNVQLIDATNDQHIWAEDYDGELTDVFKIQTDLATKIAAALQAKLSPTEKEHLERKPTQNSDAYLAFVQAHDLWSKSAEDLDKLKHCEQLYQRSIDLDPNFALAYARYSQLESWLFHSYRTLSARDKSRSLADRALALQSDLPEAHLALGFVHYYIDSNYDAAEREFKIAQRDLPNEAECYLALGAIQRRRGQWSESNTSLEKAVSLNPKDIWTLQNLAISYEHQRDFAAANKVLDRALAIEPSAIGLLEVKGKAAIEERGDLTFAEEALARIVAAPQNAEIQRRIAGARVVLLMLRRRFAEAAQLAEAIPDSILSDAPGELCGKYVNLGAAKKALGDEAGARAAFLKAKGFAEAKVSQDPGDAQAHALLAQTLAWLGEKQTALAEIARAQQLLPESKDALDGPGITATAAEIHATLGDTTEAVATIEGLLQRPSEMTVATLKLNPIWDPIRNDPRFQALIDKYSAKAG